MHAIVKLLPGRHKRIKAGHPWIYSNEVADRDAAMAIAPGSAVSIVGDNGVCYGTALFNPHSLVAGRLLARAADVSLDTEFFAGRLGRALALRERLYGEPYYRLVHAEADNLPGLIVDRYGDALAVQLNSAGMDRHRDAVLAALDATVAPRTVILRNDSQSRLLEKLPRETVVVRGDGDAPVTVRENGSGFSASLVRGQKTGWFYDQRVNRAFVAGLAHGARLIDLYAYGGGFGIQALCAGAAQVDLVDRSAVALETAAASAALNGVAARCGFVTADAFVEMERLVAQGSRYDIVVADPPAFVKAKKDLGRGSRAYRKMARLAAQLVAPGGFLFVASCSHNVSPSLFGELVQKGVSDADRSGRILCAGGAGPDHPVFLGLPETAYLKSLALQLD